jgi:hypothetical protein
MGAEITFYKRNMEVVGTLDITNSIINPIIHISKWYSEYIFDTFFNTYSHTLTRPVYAVLRVERITGRIDTFYYSIVSKHGSFEVKRHDNAKTINYLKGYVQRQTGFSKFTS